MRGFIAMFWNDKSVAERVTRMVMVAFGAGLMTMADGTWYKAAGAGLTALAVAIGAGEKNAGV